MTIFIFSPYYISRINKSVIHNMSNNNNSWKRVGGFSRTGTQNYVRTTDAAMGGTTFGPTDISYNSGNTTLRIGNNAGVVFVNGDIDMNGGPTVVAPINRIRNVRDPIIFPGFCYVGILFSPF